MSDRITAQLTHEQRVALAAISGGADVFGYAIAGTLRKLEQTHPELLEICKPMGTYPAAGRQPYFGAITTAQGEELLNAKAAA